ITVFESLEAAEMLAADGISTRVIDAYSVKPIDQKALRSAADDTELVVIAEDHWIEGGLGDAVLAALADEGRPVSVPVLKIGVTELPGSGSPKELRDWAGISASKIAQRIRSVFEAR
ncbi:MAG: transketolase, partial [Actinomycetota bacterium]|nr:transketolase [Actinomycetota bacterium]